MHGCVGCVGMYIVLTHGDVGAGGVGTGVGGCVTHYLCVKCRELSMKVVWQAGMAMV